MHYLFKTRPPNPKGMSSCLGLASLFSKSSWMKTTASGLSYELVVNGEKKIIRILLVTMDIAHFTPVNLEVLTVQER